MTDSDFIPVRFYAKERGWHRWVVIDREMGGGSVVAEFSKRQEAQEEVLRRRLEHERTLA